jgi:UDP-N-acetylmuramate--alanine ligase
VRGELQGVTVIDDYGHHPTEVRATLAAAQAAYGRRVVVLFQPHRYTRTQLLFDELACAFNAADVLLLADVYAAGETPIAGADSAHLCEALRRHGHRDVTHVPGSSGTAGMQTLVESLLPRLRRGDIVITLGAGNITQVGPQLLAVLEHTQVAHGA